MLLFDRTEPEKRTIGRDEVTIGYNFYSFCFKKILQYL